MNYTSRVVEPAPRVIIRQCGGYLVTSPPDARIQIGVFGETEAEAIETYRTRLEVWHHLLEKHASREAAARKGSL